MRLELRHIRAITALADELSFRRAAQRLEIPQPALSSQLARIEKALGVTMFERTTRSVSPTTAGSHLLPLARAVEQALWEFEDSVRALRSGGVYEIRVGVESRAVAPFVDQLQDTEVRLRVLHVVTAGDQALDAVRNGNVDVGQGYDFPGVPFRAPEHLRVSVLGEEPLWVGLPVSHPLATERSVQLAELASAIWVSGDPNTRHHEHLIRLCRSVGFTPDVRYATGSITVVSDLLGRGRCVSLVGSTSPPPPGVNLLPLVPATSRRILLVWDPVRCPPKLADFLRRAIRDCHTPPGER